MADRAHLPLQSVAARERHASGRPLEARERGEMEATLGQDFGQVRVHADSPLAALAGASALTVGSDVFFGPGLYAPGRPDAHGLLAHELTHVAQNARATATPARELSSPADESETEATRVQHAVAAGRAPRVRVRAAPSAAIHRQPADEKAISDENKRYREAKKLLGWLQTRVRTKKTAFTRQEMFDDKTATATLATDPAAPTDLDPFLDLLTAQGVLGSPTVAGAAKDRSFEIKTIMKPLAEGDPTAAAGPRARQGAAHQRKDDRPSPVRDAQGEVTAYADRRDSAGTPMVLAVDDGPFLAAMSQRPPGPDLDAPIADYSVEPRRDLVNEVANENKRFTDAEKLLPWLNAHVSAKKTGFTRQELFDDKTATAGFATAPAASTDLNPVLDLLTFHGVLGPLMVAGDAKDRGFEIKTAMKSVAGALPVLAVDDTAFLAAKGKTAALETDMRKKAPEIGLSGKPRGTANASPDRSELVETTMVTRDVGTGTGANQPFAKSIVALFNRIRVTNANWNVGQYPQHDYREYSADVRIKSGPQANGFYRRADVTAFLAALNEAAKDGRNPDGFGVFGWRAIYNDEAAQDEANAMYGTGRMISANGHGPPGPRARVAGITEAGDVHIHLDLRPMDLGKDKRLAYEMQGERVVVK